LGDPFTEEEVHNAIKQMPNDKAPDPDGYTGAFYKSCWGIIKGDVMSVIDLLGGLHAENFHWLNSANIVLLPKKEGAEEISDFRPISLIHGIAKLISKMLALRLGPFMNELVSNAQSAFIKKSIHEIFCMSKTLLLSSTKRERTPSSSSLTLERPSTRSLGNMSLTFYKDGVSLQDFGIGWPHFSPPPLPESFLMVFSVIQLIMAGD
jgi:hypothetical protein